MNFRPLLAIAVLSAGSLLSTSCGSSCEDCGGFGPNFLVQADTAPATTLGTQSTFTITVHSFDFSGPVAVAVSGIPAGWTSSVTDTSLTISASDSLKLPLVVTVPSTGPAAVGGQHISIEVTIDGVPKTVGTRLVVANEYVVPLAAGSWAGPHWGTLASAGLTLTAGATLTFRNNDTVLHRIHANGTITGLPHDAVDFAPGNSVSHLLSVAGTDALACHDHNHADVFNLTVAAAPAPLH